MSQTYTSHSSTLMPMKKSHLVLLGKLIRARREVLGYTQESFSEKINRDRAYYGRVERGLENISFSNLLLIAEGLGISAEELTSPFKIKK